MTDLLRAIILGVIEGLTEFLPISSTGHMILAMPLLGVEPEALPWKSFLYFIQIGAILAVVVYFWRRLWTQIAHRPADGWSGHLLTKLVVATLPAAAIGLPFNDWVERHLETPIPVAIALILGAGVMELIERRYRREGRPTGSALAPDEGVTVKRSPDADGPELGRGEAPNHGQAAPDRATPRDNPSGVESVTLRQAAWIGVAQVVSIIPGTSRAMATIMGGLMVGLPTAVATEFSFYLAIPTLLGAGLLKVVKHAEELDGGHAALLAVGFAAAFATALVVVEAFMRFVQTRRLRPFAIYRVVLGLVVLAWWWGAT